MSYRKIAEERQRANIAEFMEHGPGLRKSTRTFYVAKCPNGCHVIKGGLGGLGVGQAWCASWWTDHSGRRMIDRELIAAWDELEVTPYDCKGEDGLNFDLVMRNLLAETGLMKKREEP